MTTPPRVLASVLGWLTIAVFIYAFGPRTIALDDSYISLHSARVLLSGHADPVFATPALTGITSPAYVALLLALLAAGFQHGVDALRAAAALGIAAYAAGLWHLAGRAGLRARWPRAALVLAGCASGLVWSNATNGLETGWAMALLTWTIALCADAPLAAAGCAGLLPLLRPDLAPAALVLLLAAVHGQPARTRITALVVCTLAAAPFLLWIHATTGHWVPQTMRAKYLVQAEVCLPALAKAQRALPGVLVGALTMFPLSAGLCVLYKDRLGRLGLVAIAASMLAIGWTLPSSLWFNDFRYLYPILAPWAAYGLTRMLARASHPGRAAATLALATLVWTTYLGSLRPDMNAAIFEERRRAAEWIDANTPPSAVLLLHDAGVLSEYAHRRAVDLVGLKTPESMETHAAMTLASCGARRAEAIVSIAERSGATYLVMENDWGQVLDVAPAASARGLTLIAVRPSPRADWFGQNAYRIDRITP